MSANQPPLFGVVVPVVPLPLGELGDALGAGAVVVSPGEVPLPLPPVPVAPLPLVPEPLMPLVPLVPLEPPVPLVPPVAPEPLVPVAPEPLVPVAPEPVVLVAPVPPAPLLPPAPLVPDELLGEVAASPLPPAPAPAVSDFLQAPNMAAMTAAVRMIFDALDIVFICVTPRSRLSCAADARRIHGR